MPTNQARLPRPVDFVVGDGLSRRRGINQQATITDSGAAGVAFLAPKVLITITDNGNTTTRVTCHKTGSRGCQQTPQTAIRLDPCPTSQSCDCASIAPPRMLYGLLTSAETLGNQVEPCLSVRQGNQIGSYRRAAEVAGTSPVFKC
jgi:YD repeat-containing protein